VGCEQAKGKDWPTPVVAAAMADWLERFSQRLDAPSTFDQTAAEADLACISCEAARAKISTEAD
jgi:hypothetical protein